MMQNLTIRVVAKTSSVPGRDFVRGVSEFAQRHTGWTLVLDPYGTGLQRFETVVGKTDGIIARVIDRAAAEQIVRVGVPAIDVSDEILAFGLPRVEHDHQAIGRMAAEHLYTCGFRRMGFYGGDGQVHAVQRHAGFEARSHELGLECELLNVEARGDSPNADEMAALIRWVREFPEPTGLLAANDWLGHHLMLAIALAGIPVPERVGVIGVDNDAVLCDASHTPLSSIDPHAGRLGYRAAELLDRWLREGQRPPETEVIAEATLYQRRSTDVMLVDDPLVRQALTLMRCEGDLPRTVEEVLDQLPMSRRPFERRFKQALGMSPHQALMRSRIDRASALLTQSDMPVSLIAERCGYTLSHHLASAFRKVKGMTPTAYRDRFSTQLR